MLGIQLVAPEDRITDVPVDGHADPEARTGSFLFWNCLFDWRVSNSLSCLSVGMCIL